MVAGTLLVQGKQRKDLVKVTDFSPPCSKNSSANLSMAGGDFNMIESSKDKTRGTLFND
jgi:hypothetical protein